MRRRGSLGDARVPMKLALFSFSYVNQQYSRLFTDQTGVEIKWPSEAVLLAAPQGCISSVVSGSYLGQATRTGLALAGCRV